MDPVAVLEAWRVSTDQCEQRHLADDYNGWTGRGGFPALVTLADGAIRGVELVSMRLAFFTSGGHCSPAEIVRVTA